MFLAQLNIAHAVADMESPIMSDFVNNTERINKIAEEHSGFVWRFKAEESEISEGLIHFGDARVLVNMSVWKDRESLFNYIYQSGHLEIFRRKKEWFHKPKEAHMVLWYIEENHIPTVLEAKLRLEHLIEHGESPYAFGFKNKFSPEDLSN